MLFTGGRGGGKFNITSGSETFKITFFLICTIFFIRDIIEEILLFTDDHGVNGHCVKYELLLGLSVLS